MYAYPASVTEKLAEKTPVTQLAQLLSDQLSDNSGFLAERLGKAGYRSVGNTGMGDTQDDVSFKAPI